VNLYTAHDVAIALVGQRIREWRARRSYGQSELARAIGISPNALWRIERGQHQPRPAHLRKIAEVLGVSIEELRGLTDA